MGYIFIYIYIYIYTQPAHAAPNRCTVIKILSLQLNGTLRYVSEKKEICAIFQFNAMHANIRPIQ